MCRLACWSISSKTEASLNSATHLLMVYSQGISVWIQLKRCGMWGSHINTTLISVTKPHVWYYSLWCLGSMHPDNHRISKTKQKKVIQWPVIWHIILSDLWWRWSSFYPKLGPKSAQMLTLKGQSWRLTWFNQKRMLGNEPKASCLQKNV